MTARGGDLLAWLNDAITQMETTARRATDAVGGASWDGWDREVSVEAPGYDTIADGVMYGDLYEPMKQEACDHIALNDPASVLRRCAADRKLLELHAPQQDGSAFPDSFQCRTCSEAPGDGYQYLVRFPCPTVRVVAEGYGWTGGER